MNRNKRNVIEEPASIPVSHERPSPPRPASTAGPNLNAPQRYVVRVALATAGTIATLIGAQALALLDRTVNLSPIKVGVRFSNPVPQPTPAPSLDLSTDDDNASTAPSLNIDGNAIRSAPEQPLPLTLSS